MGPWCLAFGKCLRRGFSRPSPVLGSTGPGPREPAGCRDRSRHSCAQPACWRQRARWAGLRGRGRRLASGRCCSVGCDLWPVFRGTWAGAPGPSVAMHPTLSGGTTAAGSTAPAGSCPSRPVRSWASPRGATRPLLQLRSPDETQEDPSGVPSQCAGLPTLSPTPCRHLPCDGPHPCYCSADPWGGGRLSPPLPGTWPGRGRPALSPWCPRHLSQDPGRPGLCCP